MWVSEGHVYTCMCIVLVAAAFFVYNLKFVRPPNISHIMKKKDGGAKENKHKNQQKKETNSF